jgi:tRNA pseudouridine55 synthase
MKAKTNPQDHSEIIALNKPATWTSFDVVKKIRKLSGIRKVGHAGTLDPFATGVLIVCLGRATKQIKGFMNTKKEYIAQIELGTETDTMDLTGSIIRELPVPNLDEEKIVVSIKQFIGDIEQEIPAFSAAKYRGQRLYRMARRGEHIPTLKKEVKIYDIELLSWGKNTIQIRVECGPGTYIRTLGNDIAQSLGCVGYLKSLVRTRVGSYSIKDTYTIDEIESRYKKEEAVQD